MTSISIGFHCFKFPEFGSPQFVHLGYECPKIVFGVSCTASFTAPFNCFTLPETPIFVYVSNHFVDQIC